MKQLRNQKGMATIESVLLLFLFVLFMSFTTGFFSVIHVGILNSISARAYAFEVIRNRANVTYHRNPVLPGVQPQSMARMGYRVHGVIQENSAKQWVAQKVNISIPADAADTTRQEPQEVKPNLPMKGKANPVYIKTAYGICLNAKCEGT